MLTDSALSAFQAASGFSPDKLSLLIRSLLLVLTVLWSVWCLVGLIHHLKHCEKVDMDVWSFISRILVQLVLIMSLVFV